MLAPARLLAALVALLPLAGLAAAQDSGDPAARAVVDGLKQSADAPPPAPARPVSVVEAGFRDDDGDVLLLLSDGPLWLRRRQQPSRLEAYSGGVVAHPAAGRARFDFVDPRLPGQLGTLSIEPGAAQARCGAKTESLKPLPPGDIEDVVRLLDADQVRRPHYGMPRRLLESPGRELAFLELGDDDSLERRLFRVDCDGDKCAVRGVEARERPGEPGVETLELRERRGPVAGTLVDARDSGKPSSWVEALTGSSLPLKAEPATWAELEKLGVSQSDVLGDLSTPCDCVVKK